jgi:phage shock protein E
MFLNRCFLSLLLLTSPVSGVLAAGDEARAAVAAALAADQGLDAAGVKVLVGRGAILLDVRSDAEWNAGHIDGAHHAVWLDVTAPVAKEWPDKSTPIVAYCAVGARSRAAAARLRLAGYTHVIAMSQGGYEELVKAGMKAAK